MAWGSNASYDCIPCPYCGKGMIDDRSEGESTHMIACTWRTPMRHFMWKWFGWRFTK